MTFVPGSARCSLALCLFIILSWHIKSNDILSIHGKQVTCKHHCYFGCTIDLQIPSMNATEAQYHDASFTRLRYDMMQHYNVTSDIVVARGMCKWYDPAHPQVKDIPTYILNLLWKALRQRAPVMWFWMFALCTYRQAGSQAVRQAGRPRGDFQASSQVVCRVGEV